MKRTKRWIVALISSPSTCDMWFETSSAGPLDGTFSWPTMRIRKIVCAVIQRMKRARKSGTTVTMYAVVPSVATPKIRITLSGATESLSCSSHSVPEASNRPNVLKMLLVAMSRPFSWAPARCCR